MVLSGVRVVLDEVTSIAQLDDMIAIRASYRSAPFDARKLRSQLEDEWRDAFRRRLFLCRRSTTDLAPPHPRVGEVVAYVQLILSGADGDPALADGHAIAHVHDLRVHHDAQKQGIGRATMLALEDFARSIKIRTLTLGVDDSNGRALRLYEGCGYRVFKSTPGRTDDERCLYMRKEIGD